MAPHGDMGAMDENGFVYFHDRLKDMVKTGGLNVYSQEVERALQKFPAVREVAIIGCPAKNGARKWSPSSSRVTARPSLPTS
jgi:acyl-CoA synthetase (AMP-forming)/AMP-acid ligase II